MAVTKWTVLKTEHRLVVLEDGECRGNNIILETTGSHTNRCWLQNTTCTHLILKGIAMENEWVDPMAVNLDMSSDLMMAHHLVGLFEY